MNNDKLPIAYGSIGDRRDVVSKTPDVELWELRDAVRCLRHRKSELEDALSEVLNMIQHRGGNLDYSVIEEAEKVLKNC